MGTQVRTDRAEHDRIMMATIDQMRNDGDQCDFTIKAGNKQFRVHRNIISAGSEYFRAMLRHETQEALHGEVEMKDMDPECLKCCIDFIYTAEFEIPDGKICDLLYASHILQLDEVKNIIVDLLKQGLVIENFSLTKCIANLYSIEILLLQCQEFEKQNIVAISNQPEFQNEDSVHVLDLLKSPEMMMSEKEKLEVTLNWVADRDDRKENSKDFLTLLDLKEIPSDYIEDLILNNSLISKDFTLYRIFNDALKEILKLSLAQLKESVVSSDKVKNGCEKKNTLIIFNRDAGCLQSFDPKTKEISVLRSYDCDDMQKFTAVALNSYVYVLYGTKRVYRLNTTEKYHHWEEMPEMIADHGYYPPAAALLGSIFVFGHTYSTSDVFERFDHVTRQWTRLRSEAKPISNNALVAMDESIYSIGGCIDSMTTDSFSQYNISTSNWVELEPLKNAKSSCGASVVDRNILVFGGWADGSMLLDTDCFNVTTSQWSTLPLMLRSFDNIRVCHIDGYVFVGAVRYNTDTLLEYDIKNKRWREVVGIPSFEYCDFVKI